MAKLKCPQCGADVTKDKGDEIGCPCCGYAADGPPRQLYPQYPYTGWIAPYPWWNPCHPTWVGDPPRDMTPTITWDNNTSYPTTSLR